MAEKLLEFVDIRKSFGGHQAVENLNLSIEAGEFVAIMGPSGCGKTTSLRMLAGLEVPTSGQVRLKGEVINDLPVWRRNTPLVWQNLALFPFLTVRENVEFGLKMRGDPPAVRKAKARSWLERLGIAEFENKDVSRLSGGQKQRVALARALVTEPEVLLLDEPLSALDVNMSLRMQGVLKKLQRDLGITFVYVTHSHSEAFALADRVVIMNKGRIEQIGTPKEIFLNPVSRFVAGFVGGINLFEGKVIDAEGEFCTVDTADGRFKVLRDACLVVLPGDIVDVAVRADRVALTVQTGWAVNEVSCTVVSEEFVGAVINLFLDSHGQNEVVAQLQQRDLEQLNVSAGSRLIASWNPEDCRIIPRERREQPLPLIADIVPFSRSA